MPISGSFEEEYKKSKSYWGDKPSSVIFDNLGLFTPGTVLDIGAGDGRNAIFLAENGFDVTALDISPAGLKNIQEKAADKNLKVKVIEGNIKDIEIAGSYDNIITNFTLHFLGQEHIFSTVEKIVAATKPGGINIVDDFTQNGPLAKLHPENYPTEKMLVDFYENLGWKILAKKLRQVETKVYETPDKPLTHEAIAIAVQKPLQ